MKRIANFSKVSYEQFEKDIMKTHNIKEINRDDRRRLEGIFNMIKLPERSTSGSAGYDFVSPVAFTLEPGATIVIPTGIRCQMNEGWVLQIYPRSSMGFKYRTCPVNLVAIIDEDFFYSDNEGHIMIKLANDGDKTVHVKAGDKIVQGIFVQFGITDMDDAKKKRNGGIGSTGK